MVIGLTGHIGVGKTSVANFLEERGFVRVTLSDLLRDEAARRGIAPTRSNLQDLGNALRVELGPGVLVGRAIAANHEARSGLVIDGLRNPGEVAAIHGAGGVVIGLVRALHPPMDSAEEIARVRESDPAEPAWGQRVGDAMLSADVILKNDGSLEDLFQGVLAALENRDARSMTSRRR